MNFQSFNLDPRLMAGIRRANFDAPTPIQTQAIPPALAGRDLIGTAQTGTGKTAAFVLPILQRLMAGTRGRTRALIVTPTRELAGQIHDVFRALGAETGLRSATIFGGVGPAPQIQALRSGTEILVACPGRLLDLLQQGHGRLQSVEVLVLDEADRMLDMGFLPSVQDIIRKLPRERQTMLFSATFPAEIEHLAAKAMRDPQKIAVGISRPAHTVAHALYPIPAASKTSLLLAILRQTKTDSVLVFTRTKHRAEKVSRQIAQAGFRVTSLHGNRSQGQRQNALDGFKSGHFQIMVATDIAARGLDVESITHVINYDMPDTADAYIHRIGRTGRAERTGDAFTLTTPEDAPMVRELEKIIGQKLARKQLDGFDYAEPPPVPALPKPARTGSYRQGAGPRGATRRPAAVGAPRKGSGGGADRRAPAARPPVRGGARPAIGKPAHGGNKPTQAGSRQTRKPAGR